MLDAVDIPVVAAGGFFDGRGLAAALSYGAAGIGMGTRFLLTRDSTVPDAVKQRYLEADLNGTVVTAKVDGMPHRMLRTELVEEVEESSAVRRLGPTLRRTLEFKKMSGMSWRQLAADGRAMRKEQGRSLAQMTLAANTPMMLRAGLVEGDTSAGVLASGQVVGVIDDLPTCEELLDRVVTEAADCLRRTSMLAWATSAGVISAAGSPVVSASSCSWCSKRSSTALKVSGPYWPNTSKLTQPNSAAQLEHAAQDQVVGRLERRTRARIRFDVGRSAWGLGRGSGSYERTRPRRRPARAATSARDHPRARAGRALGRRLVAGHRAAEQQGVGRRLAQCPRRAPLDRSPGTDPGSPPAPPALGGVDRVAELVVPVDHEQGQQVVAAAHVAVDRRGDDAEIPGNGTHRQGRRSLGGEVPATDPGDVLERLGAGSLTRGVGVGHGAIMPDNASSSTQKRALLLTSELTTAQR